MKVAFYTLGCKVNQYETEAIKAEFTSRGWQVCPAEELADAYVVNSCTVTAQSDQKTRQIIHRFRRMCPAAVIALTGCYPQACPQVGNLVPEADVITGSSHRKQLPELVERALQTGERVVQIEAHERNEAFEPMMLSSFSERTRAFVKIEDGCNRYCSYCIIPFARGYIRSKPLDQLQQEITLLSRRGYREIVLVGVNLSSYGRDLGGVGLANAVETVCGVDGIQRVRLSSLEPDLLTSEEIAAFARQPKFCPQFHLCLQSGCDAVLQRMNRHYRTEEYRRLVQTIRSHFSNPALTTDIMVGFPGETEQEFEESLEFVKQMQFAKAHIFPYSVRSGTVAAQMPNHLTRAQKQIRVKQMSQACDEGRELFLKQQVGRIHEVLFERRKGDYAVGYAKNYLPVKIKTSAELRGIIKQVRIQRVEADAGIGEWAENFHERAGAEENLIKINVNGERGVKI